MEEFKERALGQYINTLHDVMDYSNSEVKTMRILQFLGSRQFRWPLALVIGVAAMVVLIATRGESSAPFGLVLLSALVALDW